MIKTSSLRAQNRLPPSAVKSGGFTLIELLVVIALIALIGAFMLPSVSSSFKLSLNSTTREVAAIVRESYNSAIMTGKVHRIVYDFKAGEYWVESGPNTVLLDTAETKEKEERRKRFAKPGDKPPPSQFSLERSVTRKKLSLPRGVEFEDVLTEQSPEPIKEGIAYTHFFPHGISERTIIHLKDTSNHQISLIVSPLVGRTKLVERYVKEDEPDAQF